MSQMLISLRVWVVSNIQCVMTIITRDILLIQYLNKREARISFRGKQIY